MNQPDSAPMTPPAVPHAWQATTLVGQVVAEQPTTARIFELVGIDYCCGGQRTLAVAAAEAKVDVEVLLSALAVAGEGGGDAPTTAWGERPLAELVDHIESTHHVFLRRELPRLAKIVETVTRVHMEAHPELLSVLATFTALHDELLPHLEHEETFVFPAVRKLAEGAEDATLRKALARMRTEHDTAGAAIHELRRLTGGYKPPEDACALYKQMLSGLRAIEQDTLAHVHLENNILLPRCLAASAPR